MVNIFFHIKKIWTSSIRRQLMLGIILVHAILMSLFVYDLVERQRKFLHVQSVQQAKSLAKTLAANSVSWVLSNDVIGLEETIDSLADYPSLRYAMVLSPEGRVLGHTDIDKVGLYVKDLYSSQLFTIQKEQKVLLGKSTVDIATPILSNGLFIGWASVNLSQKNIADGLEVLTRNGLIYTLLAIAIGAVFAFFMAKGITRSLQYIVDVAEGIKEGNKTLRVKLSRYDEIGKLGEDINIMLDTIDKSKSDFEMVMDNSPSLIYAKDIKGRYLFVNQKWANLFDVEKKGVIGKTDYELFDKDFADGFIKNDLNVLNLGSAINLEEIAPHDDGIHTYSSVKFPLRDKRNSIYAVCSISTDITENIKMQEEKNSLEMQLHHTQKMQAIGQLTGGIAHDFNNLLAVILGYTELSQEKYAKDNESLAKYLREIHTAGMRGRELIEKMMLFSRKDQGQKDLQPINIEPMLEETIGMLKATFPASINIKTEIQKNIPNIKADPGLITQVLMNLCLNAKDGMNKGGALLIALTVENFTAQYCSSCHETCNGEYVVITIKDNGEGIADEILNRIFEPFFTSKDVGKGTGMGLSVVHGIVHKLGGHIILTSKLAAGTTFKILLPITEQKAENNEEINVSKKQYDFSHLNIMIVDDEPAVAGFIEASLKQQHAQTKIFTNSQEALDYFKSNPDEFDLVITDQSMPGLTGADLSENLLSLRPDLAIILCTGYSAEVTEESARALGIKSFMNKPVKTDKLLSVINELR